VVRVRIAYAALGAGSSPVWVAKEAGIFSEEDLDAEVVLVRGSGRVTQAIMANEVQFANIAAPLVVEANLARSADIVFITGGVNWLVQSIVARPEIEEPAQLRGRTLGVAGQTGGVDDYLIPYLFGRLGLDPVRDVQRRPIDSQPDAIAKMTSGEIDAALFSPPYAFEATRRGFRMLIDSGDYRIDYQLGGIVASRAFIARNEDLARRMVRAYVRGVHRYKTDADFAVAALKKYSLIEDDDVARQTWAALDRDFQPTPYPTLRGIQTILDQAAGGAPAARNARAEDFADMRWVADLEASGFIARLYSGQEVVAGG
jgi:ABC-type nitrate/sulfonate/bicarbonate transport system substrate-binding protein